LAISQNSWVKARPTDKDESSPAFVERKVKSLLNKLTQEKFDSISKQIVEWANRSKNETDGMSLKLVIKQVFEKATDEAHWSEMYGRLCRTLLDDLDPEVTEVIDDKPLSGGVLFRKYLIGRCQMDFEAGWKARELAVTAAAAKSQEDKDRLAKNEADKEEGKETEAAMLSDEYYAAQKAKRRGLGLVQLVGELYKLEMISTKVIKTCLQTLLANVTDPDEEDIESTCKLLTTVGGQFEAQVPENMTPVMTRLNAILNLEGTSSRLRFMIMVSRFLVVKGFADVQDIMDLQKHHWKSKKTQSSVMTIAQIHQQAAKEQAAKAAHAAQSTRESMSRGGSRAGRQRNDEWQNVQQPARLPQRPADMSKLGNISTSQTAPTFAGPSSVFSKRGKPAVATPPLSRQTSTANMFSALNDAAEPAAEAAPERKRLVLQPRSVPAPGEEADGAEAGEVEEGEEEEEEAEEAPKSLAGMSEEAAKTKIASDMKELWGEKDQGGSRNPDDIVEYFKALPEERQPLLSAQLIDEAFRLSKLKDADIIARGLKLSLEQNVATVEVLKKG
jgi:translation initiation factor 4G